VLMDIGCNMYLMVARDFYFQDDGDILVEFKMDGDLLLFTFDS
jgi:hypothetical protein